MICNSCKEDKVKLNSSKRDRTGRFIFIDLEGRRWRGLTCPDCVKDNNKATVWKSTRFCRKERGGCGGALSADRYFLCINCKPDLGDDPVDCDTSLHLGRMV